jgi:serine/threonine-protein kinase PknG
MDGLAALQLQDWDTAAASFNAVYQQVPGELAPKLALALACERGLQGEIAERLYATCAATDATYVAPASFGMARVRAERQDLQGAVAALDRVPSTSRGYPESRQLRADVLLSGDVLDLALLDQALRSIESVSMEPRTRESYTVRILEQALEVVLTTAPRPDAKVGSHPATETGLRTGLERSYRALARDATERRQRVELVNKANAVRIWTLT